MLWLYNAIARKITDITLQRDMLINTRDKYSSRKNVHMTHRSMKK